MSRLRHGLSASVLLLLMVKAASAQLPWDTPQLLTPHAPRGMAFMATSYAVAPGDGLALVVAWRDADAPSGIGYRIVAGRGQGDRNAMGAGIDVSTWVARTSQAFPLDVIWVSGIGGAYGDAFQIALPVGLAVGRSIGDAVWFNPYAATRVVAVGHMGGAEPNENFELQLANEVGANLSFDSERRFVMRVAAAVGDRSALSVGVHLGAGRREQQSPSVSRQ